MKNKIIIILFICVAFLTGCSSQNSANINKDYKVKEVEINKKLLSKMYYENDKDAFFFSNITHNIVNNEINYYSISWLINISKVIKIDFPDHSKETIKSHFNNINLKDINITNKSDLYGLLNRINIEKNIYGCIKNKPYYINMLLKNYIKEEGLFYINGESKDLKSKIQITNIVLQIFDLIEEVPSEINSDVVIKLKRLLIDKNNFTEDTKKAQKNLIDFDMLILDSLRILDKYTDQNLKKDIQEKVKWILFWNNELNNEMLKGEININILNQSIVTMNNIAKHIDLKLKFDKKYIERLDKDSIKRMYLEDPQSTYNALLVYSILEKEIPSEITEFINFNIKYWIYKNVPNTNIKELYFGLKLAKKYDVVFDYKKIQHYIKKYNKTDKIQELYFLNLIYDEIGCKMEKNQVFIKNLNDYFSKELNYSMQEIYYLIEIYKQSNIKSREVETVISGINKELLKKYLLDIKDEKELYFLHKISEALNIKLDSELLYTKINTFKSKQNGYFFSEDYPKDNIFSTFRMLELKSSENFKINSYERSMTLNFIKSLRTSSGGYFINIPEDYSDIENFNTNFSFESFYYGIMLNEMLSR